MNNYSFVNRAYLIKRSKKSNSSCLMTDYEGHFLFEFFNKQSCSQAGKQRYFQSVGNNKNIMHNVITIQSARKCCKASIRPHLRAEQVRPVKTGGGLLVPPRKENL